MNNKDYKKLYEEIIYEKINIQKEFELYKKSQEEIINKLTKDKEKIIEHNKKSYHNKKLKKINEKIKNSNDTNI
jgi:hypothetical protein